MKTCPKCGAENRQTASECRLCATPLESAADLLEARQDMGFENAMPPERIVSGPEPADQHAPASTYAGHNVCPNCKAVSEPEWAFCQQCGAPLQGSNRQSGGGDSPTEPAQTTPSSLGAPFVAGARGEPKAPNNPAGARAAEAPAPGLSSPTPGAGAEVPASGPKTARACPNCGVLVPPGLMYCANCGRTVSTEHESKGPAVTTPERRSFPPDSAPGVPVPQPQPERAIIQMITEGGQVGDVYAITSGQLSIGRVEGDVKFPHDGYMSSQHARVVERDGRYFLVDENSRNGTFIRITDEVELKPGDTFLVGKQVFKFGTEK